MSGADRSMSMMLVLLAVTPRVGLGAEAQPIVTGIHFELTPIGADGPFEIDGQEILVLPDTEVTWEPFASAWAPAGLATFVVSVSTNSEGTFTLGFDLGPDASTALYARGAAIEPISVSPAMIRVFQSDVIVPAVSILGNRRPVGIVAGCLDCDPSSSPMVAPNSALRSLAHPGLQDSVRTRRLERRPLSLDCNLMPTLILEQGLFCCSAPADFARSVSAMLRST